MAFKFEKDEWPAVLKAFIDETKLHEDGAILVRDQYYVKNKEREHLSLQFCGWELVLLNDGTYFINDTSGG